VPRRFTRRLSRLTALVAFFGGFCTIILLVLSRSVIAPFFAPLGLDPVWYASFFLLFLLPKGVIMLSARILLPIEGRIAQKYLFRAKQILERNGQMTRIAITGSYGKTTVKHMLAALLSVRYRVLMTPASFNTPLGIAKTINGLTNTAFAFPEIFIAEMGARQSGDIQELCALVNPQVGALTAVGCQHLESFRSIENVYSTKSELCRYMEKTGGVMVFSEDDSLLSVKERYCGRRGINAFSVQMIKEDASGTTVKISFEEQQGVATLPLYGKHVAANLSLALSIAAEMGLSFSELMQGVNGVSAVSHRLQVTRLADCTVIDDSFNGNPQGAKEALRVLGLFQGRKVVITPGLVELGIRQQEENYILGKNLASSADFVVISAKTNAVAILEGLQAADFPKEKIACYPNGASLTKIIKKIKRSGDAILFLNDLPEIYA
jgi:UDP-N-acetylmuramoyl-tripeptide--D-alanyl-D-alanine ligase